MGYDIAVDHTGGALFSATVPPAIFSHTLDTGVTTSQTSGSWFGAAGYIAVNEDERTLVMADESFLWNFPIEVMVS